MLTQVKGNKKSRRPLADRAYNPECLGMWLESIEWRRVPRASRESYKVGALILVIRPRNQVAAQDGGCRGHLLWTVAG
jgi:hypothetical protein